MPALDLMPVLAKEDIIPLPMGVVPIPDDAVARAVFHAVDNARLLEDKPMSLSRMLDPTQFVGWEVGMRELHTSLITNSEDDRVVNLMAQVHEAKAPDHATSYAPIAIILDALMPIDGNYGFRGLPVRTVLYGDQVADGLSLNGASPLPTGGKLIPDAAELMSKFEWEPGMNGTIGTLTHCVVLDWMVGMENATEDAVWRINDKSTQRDPILRARHRKFAAHAFRLLPALQLPLFYWWQLRRLSTIPEVARALTLADHPITRGDEDQVSLDAILSIPMCPSLAHAAASVGQRATGVDTMFGKADSVIIPHWFAAKVLEGCRVGADPQAPWYNAVTSLFGVDGPYIALTRALAGAAPTGSDFRFALENAAGVLQWRGGKDATSSGRVPLHMKQLYDITISHTDGLRSSTPLSSIQDVREVFTTHYYIDGAQRRVADSLSEITGWEPWPVVQTLRQDYRPRATLPARDPLAVFAITDAQYIDPDIQRVLPSLTGLVALLGYRNVSALTLDISERPDDWKHLGTLSKDGATWTPVANALAYGKSPFSIALVTGQLLYPGELKVKSYVRLQDLQFTRDDPLMPGLLPRLFAAEHYAVVRGTPTLLYSLPGSDAT